VLRKALGVLPFVAVITGVIGFNRVTPLVLGLPMLLAWLLGCCVFTSAVMALIFLLDPSNQREH
jgi:hypothetical protein